MKRIDYEDEMRISSNLDKELHQQPQLFTAWAIRASEAEMALDEAKKNYDLILGEHEDRVRKAPEAYGLPRGYRVTDRAARTEAEKADVVKKAYNQMQDAKRVAKILSKIEKGFQQRKNMLESLSYRAENMYNSEPSSQRRSIRRRK